MSQKHLDKKLMMRTTQVSTKWTFVVLLALLAASLAATAEDNTNTEKKPQVIMEQQAKQAKQQLESSASQSSETETSLQVTARCRHKSSACRPTASTLKIKRLEGHPDRRSCYCDENCKLHDDCCLDAADAASLEERAARGKLQVQRERRRWFCKRVNQAFGDVLMLASCPNDWLNRTSAAAELATQREVQRRCEQVRSRTGAQVGDPMGSLLPITDLASGVTFANSHCLRCNRPATSQASRLVYWSPLLECNYDVDGDDRNALYDLISSSKGRALRFSARRNKWVIRPPRTTTTGESEANAFGKLADDENNNNNSTRRRSERECSISPTPPDAVERLVRFCRPDAVDRCPPTTPANHSARAECELGHQLLVFGAARVYRNPACAECNGERQVSCAEPPRPRAQATSNSRAAEKHSRTLFAPPAVPPGSIGISSTSGGRSGEGGEGRTSPEVSVFSVKSTGGREDDGGGDDNEDGGAGGEHSAPTAGGDSRAASGGISGSFSVLLDLYGSSQGGDAEEQVGAVHVCPDATTQVFDPFLLTCRDVVCGLSYRYLDGKCVAAAAKINDDDQNNNSSDNHNSNDNNNNNSSADAQVYSYANLTLLSVFSHGDALTSQTLSTADQTHEKPHRLPRPQQQVTDPNKQETRRVDDDLTGGAATTGGRAGGNKRSVGLSQVSIALQAGGSTMSNTVNTNLNLDLSAEATRKTGEALMVLASSAANLLQHQVVGRPLFAGEQEPPARLRLDESSGETKATGGQQAGGEQSDRWVSTGPNLADLPHATAESRRQFAECGKIVIPPQHFRLFIAGGSNHSAADESQQQVTELLQQQQVKAAGESSDKSSSSSSSSSYLGGRRSTAGGHRLSQSSRDKKQVATDDMMNNNNRLLAFVFPYNLTLTSSQFELVWPAKGENLSSSLLMCSPFSDDLVAKFKPSMVYTTTACLSVSIASLALYLLLHCLSMFDLHHLSVAVCQWKQQQQQHQAASKPGGVEGGVNSWATPSSGDQTSSSTPHGTKRPRGSCSSNEASSCSLKSSSSSGRSQNLSARGVACLAASLLSAYLLFILGHSRNLGSSTQVSAVCVALAVATYYFFLLAFNWMFLLAYDIWRTLRLATCRLRAPATHAQSVRFLTYTVLALSSAAVPVVLAVLFDQLPLTSHSGACGGHPPAPTPAQQSATTPAPTSTPAVPVSCQEDEWASLLQLYRPKFGRRVGSCWFSNRRALALFFGLPVTLITLANLLFFLLSSFMVLKTSSRSSRHLKSSSSVSSGSSTAPLAPAGDSTAAAASAQKTESSTQTPDFTSSSSSSSSSAPSSTTSTLSAASLAELNSQFNALTCGSLSKLRSQLAADSAARATAERRASMGLPLESHGRTIVHQLPPGGAARSKWRRLECSGRSSSTLTAHSVAASLAHKYDNHINSISALVSSISKDYRLYWRLSVIMGLTWLTGLMASLVDQSDLLWHLFVVLNSLQGLFIFIAFGCKKSKLANLALLLSYLRLRWSRQARA